MDEKGFYLSQYVGKTDVRPPERVYIFDTTLRDGEQTPGIAFTIDEKIAIARQLDRLGVDTIEAGFPITSSGEAEAVKRIVAEGLSPRIAALARPTKLDIDEALKTGVDYIHIFIATSDIHLEHKLKITRDEVMRKKGNYRKIAIYLVKRSTGMTNQQIGELFGGLTYSAVAKAYERFSSTLARDRSLRKELKNISI